MKPDLALFEWAVADAGYEWVSGRALESLGSDALDRAETRFLFERDRIEATGYTVYRPLISDPLLFRTFAHTQPTEDGFVSFANKYGHLGVGVIVFRDDATKVNQAGAKIHTAGLSQHDPLYRWRAARNKMREFVDVLDAIRNGDAAQLRTWFTITDTGGRYERIDDVAHHLSWVTAPDLIRDYLWDWIKKAATKDEAIFRLAKGWAQQEINKVVGRETPSTIRVVFDLDTESMAMRVCPTNLVAAMWFQCARMLSLNQTFKNCQNCGRLFELSERRRQTLYCSNRCKVAAFRRNQKSLGANDEYGWMFSYFLRVRERPEWKRMSEDVRITELRKAIKADKKTHKQLRLMDRNGKWDHALLALEAIRKTVAPILDDKEKD